MADLSVDFLGMHFPNPFLLASAPPTRNAAMIKRAFAAGWGGAVIKTIAPDPIIDLQPRLQSLRHRRRNIGMENIELTTQMSVEDWQREIDEVKSAFPDRPLWASIMDAPVEKGWQRLVAAMEETGADALELNVSCPHGMPSRGMGAFIGQDANLVGDVVRWVKRASTLPVVVKLTPNVTDIAHIALAAKDNGADALSAINTVAGLIGVDLNTLAPMPTVGGLSTYGGYSGPGVKPIALRCVAQIAKATGLPISGLGGLASGRDALEFMALGATTVQVATAVMWNGFGLIDDLLEQVRDYLDDRGYDDLYPVIGAALENIVEYPELSLEHRRQPILDDSCNGCLLCITACSDGGFQAITGIKGEKVVIDGDKCDGCGLCVMVCPLGSITMAPRTYA
jgi:dihydropyrimidine dehydrogenase (NAD+) subunit PreA